MRKPMSLFCALLLSCTLFCLSTFALSQSDIHAISPDTEPILVASMTSAQKSASLVYSGDENNASDYTSPPVYSGEVKQPDATDDPGIGGLGESPAIVEESEFFNALHTAAPYVISGAVAAYVTIKLLKKKK